MKKLILASAIATLAFVPGAYAAEDTITLNASAPVSCALGASDADSLTFGDGQSIQLTGVGAKEVTYDGAMCNGKTTVTLKTTNGGIKYQGDTTPVGNFDTNVNYTATVDWATALGVVTLTTNGTENASENSTDVSSAYNGSLVVHVDPVDTTNPLVAGAYADTLTLTVVSTI